MCGFAGIITNDEISKLRLKKISDTIIHRGPDFQGLCIEKFKNINFGLVHNRLAIQDLSKNGNQPMFSEDKQVVIVFNGEIYNFHKLKVKYFSNEYFATATDTEVILKLYLKFDYKFVDKLRGMFSMAIIDKRKGKLLLIRDRLGVKPLYYGMINDEFRFGSELKAIIEDDKFDLDKESIRLFLQFGYIPNTKSIFKGIYKLGPGNFLIFDMITGISNIRQYWDLRKKMKTKSFEIDYDVFKDDLKEAISLRSVSDVPISVFQSGGYDSTLVSSILKDSGINFTSFNIGFDNSKFDESKHALEIANSLKIKIKKKVFEQKIAKDYLNELSRVFDEPFADPSVLPSLFLSSFVSQTHKVALSADGGDELFGGYDKHRWALKLYDLSNSFYKPLILNGISLILLFDKYTKLISRYGARNLLIRLKKIQKCLNKSDLISILEIISKYIPDNLVNEIMHNSSSDYSFNTFRPEIGSPLNQMLCVDLQTHLPDQILYKVDRCTMKYSIEARDPLIDHILIEKYLNLDPKEKINKKYQKFAIRNMVWRYVKKNIIEKPKQGFSIPLNKWLREDLFPIVEEYLTKKELSNEYFNIEKIIDLKTRFYKGENISERIIWHILIFQIWKKEWKKNIRENFC